MFLLVLSVLSKLRLFISLEIAGKRLCYVILVVVICPGRVVQWLLF